MVTGRDARIGTVTANHFDLSWRTIEKVATKDIIMFTIERKREARTIINFFGSDSRKSSSAYRTVWIDKNTKSEVEEKISPSASEIANTMNNLSLEISQENWDDTFIVASRHGISCRKHYSSNESSDNHARI